MIYTTLNRIREHSPCTDGWRKLLTHLGKTGPDDEPLPLLTVLESHGLDDTLWCLRAEPQHASIWRMFAVRCARRAQHLMTDERSIRALDVAERYARGLATDEELAAAEDAARDAAWAAARGDAEVATWVAAEVAIRVVARGAPGVATRVTARVAARVAAWSASRGATEVATRVAVWDATWAATWGEQAADFKALLAAHHAMPGESCALVDWWEVKP